jgi:hypothetical protein
MSIYLQCGVLDLDLDNQPSQQVRHNKTAHTSLTPRLCQRNVTFVVEPDMAMTVVTNFQPIHLLHKSPRNNQCFSHAHPSAIILIRL